MKHLRGFRDREEWIESVIGTCKDIMLDLSDNGIQTHIFKDLYSSEKQLVIHCISFFKRGREINEDLYNEVYDRLDDYMQSEGLITIRRDVEIADFKKVPGTGNLRASSIFIEKKLGGDYKGLLDYLRKYDYLK